MKSINFTTALFVILGIGLGILNSSCKVFQNSEKIAKDKIAGEEDVKSLYDALENGGEIVLKKMIYYLETPIKIFNKNNLTLDGSGSTFIMKNKSEDVIFIENSTDITLKNFKATHVEPEGPIGCTGSVIQVYGNENIIIENCELNGSGIIGIVSYNTKNLKIIKNHIYNNSKYGILYQGDTTIEIVNNKFEDNGDNGNDHVVKALDAGLSKVEKIEMGTNEKGLKMSNNTFK